MRTGRRGRPGPMDCCSSQLASSSPFEPSSPPSRRCKHWERTRPARRRGSFMLWQASTSSSDPWGTETSDHQCNQRVRRIGSPFRRRSFHALRCLLLAAAPAGRARGRLRRGSCSAGRPCRRGATIELEVIGNDGGTIELTPSFTLTVFYPRAASLPEGADRVTRGAKRQPCRTAFTVRIQVPRTSPSRVRGTPSR